VNVQTRRVAAATIAFSLVLADARPALAHGFGPTYDIPIPLWLYLYAAAAAVVLAFVPLALFSRKERDASYRYPSFDLFRIRLLRTLLTSRLLVGGLRLLSVLLFFLVVIAGLVGLQSGFNIAPTFVWVTWLVGLSFFTALVGNVWPLVNPWRVLFDWAEGLARRLGYRDGLELGERYPEALGVWPAVGLYLVFAWIENVFSGSYVPRNIAFFALAYTMITLYAVAFFGKETWLRRGEVFSVFFGLLGRFAPTEVRVKNPNVCRDCEAGERCVNCYECFVRAAPEERELNLRPPAVGLGLPERVPPGGAAFVIVVLAGVTFDGLLQTPLWLEIVRLTPVAARTVLRNLPGLRGVEPDSRWGRLRAVRGRVRFLARADRHRLPDGPLLHVPANSGTDDNLARLRSFRVGLGPLRHRRFRAPLRDRRGGLRLVLAGRAHRGGARDRRLSGPLDLAAPPSRPRTRLFEPATYARLDGPLHDNEPLDPGPAHRQVICR
jgi:hypothetical protein